LEIQLKRIIEITNYNDPSELKKVISQLQSRRKTVLRKLGYDQITFNGSKYNCETILPIINEYYDSTPNNFGNHYVYFHCNTLKPLFVKNNLKHLFLALKFPGMRYEPFYVGKGVGNRAHNLHRNVSHRKIRSNLIKYKKDIEVFIAEKNLDENSALLKESYLIDILGLISLSKHGILTNLDEGVNSFNRVDRLEKTNNPVILKKLFIKNGFKI
jgi:hypothetical protein